MRAELLPDAYSPFLIESEVLLIPVLLALRRSLAAARAVHDALETQAEARIGSLRAEGARLRLRLQLLHTLLSFFRSGLDPDEATRAARRLTGSQPADRETGADAAADGAVQSSETGIAKRAFRCIVSATHPDHAIAALFALAVRGVDADEFLSAAITAQQTHNWDDLVALAVVLIHLAPDTASDGAGGGLGLARHEERDALRRAIQALQAEQVAVRDSPLTAARIPNSQPPRLAAAYIERLIAQHRSAIAILEAQIQQAEQELAQCAPAEVAAVQAILQEYGL